MIWDVPAHTSHQRLFALRSNGGGGGGIHGKMPRDQEGVQCALRPKERALVRFGYPRTLSDKSGQKEFLNGLLFNRHRACSYW